MHHAINEYQLRLDVQHFLWPVYYITWSFKLHLGCNLDPLFRIFGCYFSAQVPSLVFFKEETPSENIIAVDPNTWGQPMRGDAYSFSGSRTCTFYIVTTPQDADKKSGLQVYLC